MEAHVVEGGVVPSPLSVLHLGLDATDSSVDTNLAPSAVPPPVQAAALQQGAAAAAEPDVVGSGVVFPALTALHAELERGEHATGAVLRVGPVAPAGDESRKHSRVNQI